MITISMSGRRWMIPRMKCSTPLHLWRNDTWQKSYKEADSCSLLQTLLYTEEEQMVSLSHTIMETGNGLQQPPSPTAVWTPMRQHILLNLASSELCLGSHNQLTLCTLKCISDTSLLMHISLTVYFLGSCSDEEFRTLKYHCTQ